MGIPGGFDLSVSRYEYSLEVTKVRRGRKWLYFVPVNFVSAFSRVCCENEAGSSGVAETNSYRRRVFDNHRRSFRIGDEEKRDRSGRFITKDEIRVTFVTKTSSTDEWRFFMTIREKKNFVLQRNHARKHPHNVRFPNMRESQSSAPSHMPACSLHLHGVKEMHLGL